MSVREVRNPDTLYLLAALVASMGTGGEGHVVIPNRLVEQAENGLIIECECTEEGWLVSVRLDDLPVAV